MKNLLTVFLTIVLAPSLVFGQDEIIPLYDDIPCSNDLQEHVSIDARIGRVISKVHQPELWVYNPKDQFNEDAGVMICPGGGYTVLAWDWEGTEMAEWLNELGITAYVLKYRLPHWETDVCNSEVALLDAKKAMEIIRSRSSIDQISPERIGVMGFSAGGHLASTLSTHFEAPNRPNFSILMYPVISMDTAIYHGGSKNNLIGKDASQETIDFYSNDLQVKSNTPKTFLVHAEDDLVVPKENTLRYANALKRKRIKHEVHLFPTGGHGFALGTKKDATDTWPALCEAWLRKNNYLKTK